MVSNRGAVVVTPEDWVMDDDGVNAATASENENDVSVRFEQAFERVRCCQCAVGDDCSERVSSVC